MLGRLLVGKKGTAESKVKAFEQAGIPVAKVPSDIVRLLKG